MNQAEREFVESTISKSKITIWIKFQQAGVHSHPNSLSTLLTYPHRHIFYFNVGIQTIQENREYIEPIYLKNWCENLYLDKILQLDNKSCEEIANDLYLQIWQRYPYRNIWIDVSEDNETGYHFEYLV